MTRKTAFLAVQSVLCALAAGLLAAAALQLYLDGAAKQAEGDRNENITEKGAGLCRRPHGKKENHESCQEKHAAWEPDPCGSKRRNDRSEKENV